MRLYWNELALSEAHVSREVAAEAIEDFLSARYARAALARAVYCARTLPDTVLGDGQPLKAIVPNLKPEVRSAFYRWASASGPFLEDQREAFDDDLFLLGAIEVTDLGLGEAARQILRQRSAGVFSPAAKGGAYTAEALSVTHGFPDEPIALIDVTNICDLRVAADRIAAAEPEPARWAELLTQCRDRYPALLISPHCDIVLARYPFERNVARRTFELLNVLQRIVEETDKETGALSPLGREIQQQHFVGSKAWFSDAGNDEKNDFREAMTFPDPEGGDPITMFWHGKVKTPQYRIHFDWPIRAPYKRLCIGYIGPKISKS